MSPTGKTTYLALVTDGFGGYGGIARYNQDFLQALAEAPGTTRVLVLPRNRPRGAVTLPDNIVQFEAQRSRIFYALKAVALACSQRSVDVVFCGHTNYILLARAVASLGKARLWIQLHGIESWQRPNYFCRMASETADLVTAVSRYTRRRFLEWASILPRKVRVLPNTVGDRFSPGPRRSDLVARYGLSQRKVLLTVGRLSSAERYKGQDRVIEVLPDLVKTTPQLIYLIAGEGPDRERLESLVREKGLEGRVVFLGEVGQQDLPDIYRLADVYVMPSTGEGFGIVFLEAIASGLPAIGGNADGSIDPLVDGCMGILVDPENRHELILAIEKGLTEYKVDAREVQKFKRHNFSRQVGMLATSIMRSTSV